jgi:AcrR family transcriptional regulator
MAAVNSTALKSTALIFFDAMTRTGRRSGESGSRQAIAAAAERHFGLHGYDGTTIRAIADDAGVDPALVIYFFGSKEKLFAACVQWPFDPADTLPAVLRGPRSRVGERLARLFTETWDAEDGRNPIVALLRAAMTQEAAQRRMRSFLESQILAPLTAGLRVDEPELRGSLAATQLIGLGIGRHVLRFEPLASLGADEVVALAGPQLQRSLVGALPRRGA